MSVRPVVIASLLAVALVAGAAPVASQEKGYDGTHVSFTTAENTVVNYTVNRRASVAELSVQSKSAVDSALGVTGDLAAVTSLPGSTVALISQNPVRARLTTGSGARVVAHDNSRGSLVVRAGGQSQYVTANLSGRARPTRAGPKRVVVQGDGHPAVFLVTGGGSVTVNEAGNVAAQLGEDARLVYRTYPKGRSADDRHREELITQGTLAAGVYLLKAGDGPAQRTATTADVVAYTGDTAVTVTGQAPGRLSMTVERSAPEGRLVVATLSQDAFATVDDVNVTVDGQPAERVSAYGPLRRAAVDNETSRYHVDNESSAEATGEVTVAVDHFSSRSVTVHNATAGSVTPQTDGSGPGFGVGAALAALVALAVFVRRCRRR